MSQRSRRGSTHEARNLPTPVNLPMSKLKQIKCKKIQLKEFDPHCRTPELLQHRVILKSKTSGNMASVKGSQKNGLDSLNSQNSGESSSDLSSESDGKVRVNNLYEEAIGNAIGSQQ